MQRIVHRVEAVEVGADTAYRADRLVVGRDAAAALFADRALAAVRL